MVLSLSLITSPHLFLSLFTSIVFSLLLIVGPEEKEEGDGKRKKRKKEIYSLAVGMGGTVSLILIKEIKSTILLEKVDNLTHLRYTSNTIFFFTFENMLLETGS